MEEILRLPRLLPGQLPTGSPRRGPRASQAGSLRREDKLSREKPKQVESAAKSRGEERELPRKKPPAELQRVPPEYSAPIL